MSAAPSQAVTQAVVLVGGLGTRLRPVLSNLPKAMAPVAGRPFLEYKIEQLRRAWAVGDKLKALRIAARFPRLGKADAVIRRAAAFSLSPRTYQQMGYDYDKVLLEAYAALERRYKLAEAEFVDA